MSTVAIPVLSCQRFSFITLFVILGITISCSKSGQEIPLSSFSFEDSVVQDYGSVEIKCQISGNVSVNNLEVEYADNSSLSQSSFVKSKRIDSYSFSTTIDNIKVNTTYYYRYIVTNAVNSITDTKIRTFSPLNYSAPVVNTVGLKQQRGTSVLLDGDIRFTSGERILEKGFLFGEQQNSLSKYVCADDSFELEISKLRCGTKYYYQAYVLSEVGEGKGEIMSFYTSDIEQPFHYLTFTSSTEDDSENSLILYNCGGNAPELYYSTDAVNWYKWDYSRLPFSKLSPIYLCGNNENGFSSSRDAYSHFSSSHGFECSGNIMSLINKDKSLTTIPNDFCFYALFVNCVMYQSPDLPATTLKSFCYYEMFKNSYILKFPALPATELADYCYYSMFEGCKWPIDAPKLPAEVLYKGCYNSMFRNTYIYNPPSWSVKRMAYGSCESMFEGCTFLTSIIRMNNIELDEYCCENMYSGCLSLSSVSLSDCVLKKGCFYSMFKDCTSLQSASLSSNGLVQSCYAFMFNGCSSLSSVSCYAYHDNSEFGSTYKWLEGVSKSGKFTKVYSASFWERGDSGIPSDWTIYNRQW